MMMLMMKVVMPFLFPTRTILSVFTYVVAFVCTVLTDKEHVFLLVVNYGTTG